MRKLIRKLVEFNLTWRVLHFFYKFFYRFKFEKDLIEIEKRRANLDILEVKFKKIFSNLTVLHGPFKGMVYPDFMAYGSSLYPKLLGSYEAELNETVETFLKNDYDSIIDVGCAEGYYAVGFAMRKPNTKVFAYDLNKDALVACEKMAKLNKVTEQIEFGEFCSSQTLADFKFKEKSLIISDCEGYELDLFTPESVANLTKCDILIELHDLYNEKISPSIEAVFKNTHNIKKVYSESTFKKMKNFKESATLTDIDINSFMLERNGIMAWAIITPK